MESGHFQILGPNETKPISVVGGFRPHCRFLTTCHGFHGFLPLQQFQCLDAATPACEANRLGSRFDRIFPKGYGKSPIGTGYARDESAMPAPGASAKARAPDELKHQKALIRELQRPTAFPHEVDGVRMLETHISYVVLTGRYAYKVKKAVDLGFVDYRTLE